MAGAGKREKGRGRKTGVQQVGKSVTDAKGGLKAEREEKKVHAGSWAKVKGVRLGSGVEGFTEGDKRSGEGIENRKESEGRKLKE